MLYKYLFFLHVRNIAPTQEMGFSCFSVLLSSYISMLEVSRCFQDQSQMKNTEWKTRLSEDQVQQRMEQQQQHKQQEHRRPWQP